uniref:Putative ovule protein n=1 Tax=Solanum chacoense TaxID=4108 RepID=A0A0V0GZ41_SOLCH
MSNMNYPSIAISLSKVRETKKVTRTLTRIGDEESEYTATITTPDALRVEVSPKKLKFTNDRKKLSYQVTFKAMSREREFFGQLHGLMVSTRFKVHLLPPFGNIFINLLLYQSKKMQCNVSPIYHVL